MVRTAFRRTVVSAKRLLWVSPRLNRTMFLLQNATMWIRSSCARNSRALGTDAVDPEYQIASMVRVRNEEPFIAEWIVHHLMVGIEHFYVYDNASTDRTYEVLKPFIDRGVVTHIPWDKRPITPSAELDFFRRYAHQSTWVAFFDSDEFLEVRCDRSLVDILDAHTAPAIAVNWRLYGSSWKRQVPRNGVLQNLQHCEEVPERTIKVIARSSQVAALRNPHNFYYKRGRIAKTAEGSRVYGSFAEYDASMQLELRHFVYRGDEDYVRKNSKRHAATASHQLRGRADHDFEAHNALVRPFAREHIDELAATLRALVEQSTESITQ